MFNNDLDSILNIFQKAHSKLEAYIARQSSHIADKQDQISDLNTQITEHVSNHARATQVRDNIKKLLSL